MLINEILESDADTTEMKLRKIARQLRSGEISFPEIYGFFYSDSEDNIDWIRFPTKGLWIGKGTLKYPHQIKNDILLHLYTSRSTLMADYSFLLILNPVPPSQTKDYNYKKLKDAIISFFKEYFKKYLGTSIGHPRFDSFDHYQDHIRVNVSWFGLTSELDVMMSRDQQLLKDLIKHKQLNNFANLVRTAQHAN